MQNAPARLPGRFLVALLVLPGGRRSAAGTTAATSPAAATAGPIGDATAWLKGAGRAACFNRERYA